MTAPVTKAVLQDSVNAFAKAGRKQTLAAETLGISRAALQERLRKAKEAGIVPGVPLPIEGKVADPRPLVKENEQLRATIARMTKAANARFKPTKVTKRAGKDDVVRAIWPDSHGTYADPVAMGVFLHDLALLQPEEVVMLGDHVDCGGFLAQHHVIGYVAQGTYTYEDDVEAARQHLDQAQKAAPKAKFTYIEGNHEDRVERWCMQQTLANSKDGDYLRRAFAPCFLLGLAERGIDYVRRSVCYDGLSIPGTRRFGKCLFLHDPGISDPRRALARFGTSLVHGHDHASHANVSATVGAGEIGIWSFGCLALRQQLYAHSRPTGHTNGYGIQLVSRSGHFLTISVPIIGGVSYLNRLLGSRV